MTTHDASVDYFVRPSNLTDTDMEM